MQTVTHGDTATKETTDLDTPETKLDRDRDQDQNQETGQPDTADTQGDQDQEVGSPCIETSFCWLSTRTGELGDGEGRARPAVDRFSSRCHVRR